MGGKKKRRKIRSGRGCRDAAAWATLYRQYHPRIRSRLAAGGVHEQDMEDLTQEVFARLARGDAPADLPAYIATIAGNALSRYRLRRAREHAALRRLLEEAIRESGYDAGAARAGPADDEPLLAKHGASAEEVLRTLSLGEAQLLRLRFVAGLPVAEVARRVGCSRAAAYKRLERAIRRLRERYGAAPNPRKNPGA
jgi:RNA polymerase sigma factor (sigma-70 family)